MSEDAERDYWFKVAEAVAHQITAEQNLVSARLNWNLTFQGFMIASYALVSTADVSSPKRSLIQFTIIVAGLVVTAATLAGVMASAAQRSALRKHWQDVVADRTDFPRPFVEGGNTLLGRSPAFVICITIIAMWAALMTWGLGATG
ncbi:MAG: hypothetical protein U1C74_09310 [Phenylobacterium sp.]|nr:hypothetical protein [Phenylobacterium sp.]